MGPMVGTSRSAGDRVGVDGRRGGTGPGGCRGGLLLGDEGVAGGGEAVAVVEDVPAHLRQLLDPVGHERLAAFVLGATGLLAGEPLAMARAGEPAGVVEHSHVELVGSAGDDLVGEAGADRI